MSIGAASGHLLANNVGLWRLITHPVLFSGVIDLLVLGAIQLFIVARAEQMYGSFRVGGVWLAGAVAGGLGSAAFLPVTVVAGCAGAVSAVLAALMADAVWRRKILISPGRELSSELIILAVVCLISVLPGAANLFQILFGFLAGALLAPMTIASAEGARRVPAVAQAGFAVALVVLIVGGAVMVMAVVETDVESGWCPGCEALTCLPIVDWCDGELGSGSASGVAAGGGGGSGGGGGGSSDGLGSGSLAR